MIMQYVCRSEGHRGLLALSISLTDWVACFYSMNLGKNGPDLSWTYLLEGKAGDPILYEQTTTMADGKQI